ncbi:family 20 glycosylhydrolase, partial [Alistipes onderdonkii]
PRYGYRGLHLDVCRHFFPVEFVKGYLDRMAAAKLNRFHWHLTDDQGWRIEIKRYPRLTQVGAWRSKSQIGSYEEKPATFEFGRYGGFYTQDEIREVVAYAAERYITVIPEIEMPGHSLAALTAYPWLGCTNGDESYEIAGWICGPGNVLCPGKESTFEFLENVLDEVVALFPSKLIHIGGDECQHTRWEACPDCQARIAAEGLRDETQLQSYLTHRIDSYLTSKGRQLIGWDEIMEGGLSPGAVIMSWRGTQGGIAAAREYHHVVMTPGQYLYFDKRGTDSPDEPVSLNLSLPLEKIYGYDPAEGLSEEEQQYLLGVQANLWTEFVATGKRVEYQLLPRIYALSEIAWSPVARKSWEEFSRQRLPAYLARLDAEGAAYQVPQPHGIREETLEGGCFRFTIRPPFPGCRVYYTLNGATPYDFDREVPDYLEVVVPPGEQRVLKCVAVTPAGRRSMVVTTRLGNPGE